jgi:hypothetical protein
VSHAMRAKHVFLDILALLPYLLLIQLPYLLGVGLFTMFDVALRSAKAAVRMPPVNTILYYAAFIVAVPCLLVAVSVLSLLDGLTGHRQGWTADQLQWHGKA